MNVEIWVASESFVGPLSHVRGVQLFVKNWSQSVFSSQRIDSGASPSGHKKLVKV